MIEQLHYTWARHGLQGSGRFQVVAASPLLRNLDGDLARLALRLCRWSAGADPGTISFGWLEAQGYRLIFRRAPASKAGNGRHRNFTAHILVAPVGMLEVNHLFRPGAPGLWWDGATVADLGVLPTLPVQPVGPPLPEARPQDVENALAEMLALEFRGQIRASWAGVHAAAAAAAAVVPQAFTDVTAFSTYESADTAGRFTLAGIGDKVAPPAANPAALAAAQLLLSNDPLDARLLRSVADGTTTWPDFVALANALIGLRDGDGDGGGGGSQLVPALNRPSTAQEVLSSTGARASVAASVAAGRAELLTPLTRSLSLLTDDIQLEMGRSIGAALDQRELGWSRTPTGIGQLPARTLEGLAECALAHVGPDSCRFWPLPLLTACLRLPPVKGSEVGDLVDAILVLDGGVAVMDDLTIPTANRVALATTAIERRAVSPERMSRLMRQNRDLEGALLPLLEGPGDLWSILESYPPFLAVQAVRRGAKHLPLKALTDTLTRLLPLLDEGDAKKLQESFRHLRNDIPSRVWDDAADRTLMVFVGKEVHQSDRRLSAAALSAQCSNGPVGAAAKVLLYEVVRASHRFDSPALARVADALTLPDLELQPELRAFAAQALVQEATHYEHLERIISDVARPLRENAFDWFVLASLRNLASGAPGSRRLAVLTLRLAIAADVATAVTAPVARRLDRKGWDELEAAFADAGHRERRRFEALVKAAGPARPWSWFTSSR